MTFNSISFAFFFSATYAVYLLLRDRHTLQNRWLLAASCFFYSWWDWRFLGLMMVTISADYFIARAIASAASSRRAKSLLALSVASNLAVLGFFKYFNFFSGSFSSLAAFFGLSPSTPVLNVILPIGISFYTFQAMSYVIDVYRKDLTPVSNLLDYAAFITYFPQLVAGPIERGAHLLPQILRPRIIRTREFYEGCHLIFWGLFQKVFVADNLAKMVEPVFSAPGQSGSFSVLMAVYAFAIQIYCDFAGYSDIARGLGKCMGFDIMRNFNLPYFSTHAREFWEKWHISFSTWLRDYLYIPLGGNRLGKLLTLRNLFLTMLLGGLWHGAKWTFVLWGAYHGLLLIADRLLEPVFRKMPVIQNKVLSRSWFLLRVIFLFHAVCFGWILFRAHSFSNVTQMFKALFFNAQPLWTVQSKGQLVQLIFYAGFFLAVQIYQYVKTDLLAMDHLPRPVRWGFYYVMLFSLLFFGGRSAQFIYFQF